MSVEIQNALRLRYPSNSHALLWEVSNSTGANIRRYADAVAIGLWPSHGHEIEGIEIKNSRQDWLRERANPEKSHAVYQYCNRWWLACPKGLVAPDELPPTWGMLELVGNAMRVKHKAPVLEPKQVSLGFMAALLRRHAGADDEMTERAIRQAVEKETSQIRLDAKNDVERRRTLAMQSADEAMKKIAAIKEATGIDLESYHPPEKWIRAIKYLTESGYRDSFSADNFKDLRRTLSQLLGEIEKFPIIEETARK